MTRQELPLHVLAIGLLAAVAALLPPTGLDDAIAAHYFDPSTHRFPLRDAWLFRDVLHDGMHDLLLVIAGLLLAPVIANRWSPERVRHLRPEFTYMVVVLLLGTGLVSLLKDVAPIYCPWSLADFGADRPHYTLAMWLSGAIPSSAFAGHCWPSSHAAGAFALIGTYFAARARNHPHAGWLLAGVIAFGGLLGWAQIARGAHFASHVVWALVICWAVALACYPALAFARRRAGAAVR